mgnify:CR=1 FL=1
MEGWISLHRKLLDNPIICKDSDYLSVWIFLLLSATHKEYDSILEGKRITLKKGQLITGRKSIADKLKISESKVQRILKCFENEQQIKQQTNPRNRLITILNWDKYQQLEQQTEQQLNNKRTTSEQQVNTNNNINNVIMKQCNKNKKEKTTEFDKLIDDNFQNDEELKNTVYEFIKMRKAIKKPLTTRGLELMINKLYKITTNTNEQIEILNNSIMNNWQGIFPLKQKKLTAEEEFLND